MLKTRIITALVLMIGFLLALFNTSSMHWSIITLAAALIGVWEWSKLIKLNHTQLLISVASALAIGLILTLASMTPLGHYSDELVLSLIHILRGMEMNADIVIKATKVDGIYTEDPKTNPDAMRYKTITFDEAIAKNLKVMDATALTLCRDQKLPICVFSIFKQGALKKVVMGGDEGTMVTP